MATAKKYSVTDSTGSSPSVEGYYLREQVWLRNAGPDTAYLAFNETASASAGMYLEIGDAIIIAGRNATKDIHMVCDSGETAEVYAELGYGTPDPDPIESSSSSSKDSSSSSEEYSNSSTTSSEEYSTSSSSDSESSSSA